MSATTLSNPPAPPAAPARATLTPDQKIARLEILKARKPRRRHLLTGWAGTGKTKLMQEVVQDFQAQRLAVAVTAPTHKAVAVLARKLAEAGIMAPCLTTHSLLSLEPKPGDNGVMKLKRRKYADPITADAVIIDECSMVDSDLHGHIDRHLHSSFVLYVGDPAQLPPVNEKESLSFATRSRSHLDTIVRQEADNPILDAATVIRESQGSPAEWSWCRPSRIGSRGVFLPNGNLDAWLSRAFTSSDFAADNDTFRYLCWTNARVAQVNAKVRRWIYGETDTPLSPGEMALIRQPIIRDKAIIFATNQEAKVASIKPSIFRKVIPERDELDEWRVEIPSWEVELCKPDGGILAVHMPRDDDAVAEVNDRIVSEARIDVKRWGDRVDFQNALARLQAVYALTTHTSQGSTFKSVFVDIADIRRRERSNLLEMQQMLYVAATRPTTSLMLVGV